MKRLVIFICLLILSSNIFSQLVEPQSTPLFTTDVPEILVKEGYFVNRVDIVEDKIDSLVSKSFYAASIYGTSKTISDKNIITFSELDNLLVIENSYNKTFHFLEFLFEEGVITTTSKFYLSDKGENITINYNILSDGTKEITHICIHTMNKVDYLIVFFLNDVSSYQN